MTTRAATRAAAHGYELWIDWAEAAYSSVVHSDAYCKSQAEAIHTLIGLPAARAALRTAASGSTIPPRTSGADGCSLRDAVWKQDKVVLYRYRPLPFVQAAPVRPVLLCFSTVNRPHVLDLQPDRSFIRNLLAAGLEVYLIDWGYPDARDHAIALRDYVERYLDGCVSHILESERVPNLNLVGMCQGGTLSLCYCALHPRHIANLVLLATPVDFHTPQNLLAKWARHLDMQMLTRSDNVPGGLLTGMFMALNPFRRVYQKQVALLDQTADARAMELFGRMEQWMYDSPDQAGTAARQFVQWLFQENRLVKGTLRIGSRPVNLGRIESPVLNIYGTQDHLVPPSATTALGAHLRNDGYTERALDTGHIGLYVSRQAGRTVARTIRSWLRAHS